MIVNDLQAVEVFRCADSLGWEGDTPIKVEADPERGCLIISVDKTKRRRRRKVRPAVRLVHGACEGENS